jgi:hypothetical protein
MAGLWTQNIERDPRYRGAAEVLEAAGYAIAISDGLVEIENEESGDRQRFRARKELLAFASAIAAGEQPQPVKRSAPIRNGQGFGGRQPRPEARDSDPPPAEKEPELDLAKLKALCQALVIERDAWKARAQIRETAAAAEPSGSDEKYRALKKFIAREFHPDNVRADGIERLVRTEVFKTIWAHIEEIERAGRS